LLKELAGLDEAFPFIPLMFVKHKQVSGIARQKVSELLAQAPVVRLASFDEKIRKFAYPNYYEVLSKYWYNLESSIIETIDDNKLVAIKILCCHPNGYVRFNALNALVKLSINAAIPFLLLRANDWVEALRVFCHDTLLQAINDNTACAVMLDSLSLVKQLKGKGRDDQGNLTDKIEQAFLTHCKDELFNKIQGQDRIASRYAFSILASSNDQREQLLAVTIDHQDIIIKLNAFNLAKAYYDSNQLWGYLSKLINDKFVPIRKMVLYALIELYPHQAQEYLEQALFDRCGSIRNLGRYYLKQRGIHEFSHYYIDALNNQGAKPHLLLGLSEAGNKDDFLTMQPFINTPGLQAASIVAVFKLKPDDWKNIIRDLIKHPNSSRLKAISTCLINAPESYSFSEMIELVYQRESMLQLRYFLKIIAQVNYGSWRILNFILDELIYYKDDENKLLIEHYLELWITRNSPNKNFTRLSVGEFTQIGNKLAKIIEINPTRPIYKGLMEHIQYFVTRR
jgi:hypothetical protein